MTVLLVVLTVLVFLAIDIAVIGARDKKRSSAVGAQPVGLALPVRIPEGIYFARTHTWMSLFPSGRMRLGVDDFVGRLLDTPSISYLKEPHQHVQKGEPILLLKDGGHTLTVRAPMDGEILDRNVKLTEEPNRLKESLFTDGWAYTIVPARHSDIKQLLLGEETRRWLVGEFSRLRDVFAQEKGANDLLPALLQDGGPPLQGALKYVLPEAWERFERAFLRDTV
jgi:glycine cleavage system H lipoate-binding protein